MQQRLFGAGLAGLIILAGCGVPPEEDAAARSNAHPLERSLFLPVTQDDLAQSESWAEMVQRYR
jgi:hypothetical protein